MKKIITLCCLLSLFISCNDREPDFTFNPPLDLSLVLPNTPVLEDDSFQFTLNIQQEQGSTEGAYSIKLNETNTLGKVFLSDNTEVTDEWVTISRGETILRFQGISRGNFPLALVIRDPFGNAVTQNASITVLSRAPYIPFADAPTFIRQQFKDIWDVDTPTEQQINHWNTQLEDGSIDRDDLLVSFINNQIAKNRLDITSDDLEAQVQRAYLTLLRRQPTTEELETASTTVVFKTIVRRLFTSEAYQERFAVDNLSISDFRFTMADNPALPTDLIAEQTNTTFSLVVSPSIDISSLRPQFELPVGAISIPAIGEARDFTQPMEYTVLAINGNSQTYTIQITALTEVNILRILYEANPQSQTALGWDITSNDLGSYRGVTLTNGRITRLTLAGEQLTTIPPELGALEFLTTLDLSSNSIQNIPDELSTLRRLQTLNLSENQIATFPTALNQLQNLVSINLNGNLLDTFNVSIGDLQALTSLNLGNNQFTTFPIGVVNLESLGSLSLKENQIQTLPSAIRNLNLIGFSEASLDLSNNLITTLPTEIANIRLSALSCSLNLSHNRITTLPPEISGVAVSRLNLSHNLIQTLPPEIGNLDFSLACTDSGATLDLSNNQITTLPPEIAGVNPWQLRLDNNRLTTLPPEIYRTQALVIRLDSNQITELPDLNHGVTFDSFDVRNNPIPSVPTSLCLDLSRQLILPDSTQCLGFP